ncbi:hypothetical protein D3C76_1403980 [compost metagenome]
MLRFQLEIITSIGLYFNWDASTDGSNRGIRNIARYRKKNFVARFDKCSQGEVNSLASAYRHDNFVLRIIFHIVTVV